MEALIDLNGTYDHVPASTSVLRRREPTAEDRMRATLVGFLWGFGISLAVALATSVFVLLGISIREISIPTAAWIGAGWLAIGSILGIRIAHANLDAEAREGFLHIDRNRIEFWSKRGIREIDMGTVFGAGPDRGTFGQFLRICCLSDIERGFAWVTPNFKHYEAASGPATRYGSTDKDGNVLAREAIGHHVDERRRAELPTAEFPPYKFESVQSHRKHIFFGDPVVDASFSCDGKTVIYTKRSGRYEFPVASVRGVKVHEVRSKYGRTAYTVTLDLDPAYGHEKLKIDILRMPHADEIDKYCRCLPTHLPTPTLEGYWN